MPGAARRLRIETLGRLRENGRIARCHLNEVSIG